MSDTKWHWYHANGLNRYVVADTNHNVICGLPEGGEKNTRLIAAAPDLLAVCEYLIKCSDLAHWALVADEEITLVEMAEAAIKKARGIS